ncbi:MAG: hypothetical protein AAF869_10245 [Pseudomonadota bacterium]
MKRAALFLASFVLIAAVFAASFFFVNSRKGDLAAQPLVGQAPTHMIVVSPGAGAGEGAEETAADWSYYLDGFIADYKPDTVTRLKKRELGRYFARHSPISGEHATIFIKGPRSFYFEGQALEPTLYELCFRKLDDPAADAGYEGLILPFKYEMKPGAAF